MYKWYECNTLIPFSLKNMTIGDEKASTRGGPSHSKYTA